MSKTGFSFESSANGGAFWSVANKISGAVPYSQNITRLQITILNKQKNSPYARKNVD